MYQQLFLNPHFALHSLHCKWGYFKNPKLSINFFLNTCCTTEDNNVGYTRHANNVQHTATSSKYGTLNYHEKWKISSGSTVPFPPPAGLWPQVGTEPN